MALTTASWDTNKALTTVGVRYEHDVVVTRQRARQIAEMLGFDNHDQVRIATAVSEIARNAFRYAGSGKAQFGLVETPTPALRILVSDEGQGIRDLEKVLGGSYVSETGMGMGILGARRLMDLFDIHSGPGGTRVLLQKALPKKSWGRINDLAREVANRLASQQPEDPFQELQRQNQELLGTLQELQKRQAELAQLNKELQDTNRGVVALYSELDERADYLRRASELKTQFLSNMTHEFRTPLNSILSLSRMLLERIDGELGPEQEKQVVFIQHAARDLSELVNDLLDLAKVEAGKVKVRPEEFRVEDLFGALRGMLRPLLAHNSAVNLVFEGAQDIPPLQTDESKVSQILRNLISNALKFTSQGEVVVSAGVAMGDMVEFSVADTGIGIASEHQESIFEEFMQVEGAHQTGHRGTGLGLPLSRKLARLLGGTLTVKSAVGKGSTFTLCIPSVYQGQEVVSTLGDLPSEIDPLRVPVLIVEDNQETLFVYERFLRGTVYQAIPARTLKQARRALESFSPAAIILDIMLSHESTWTFLSELREQQTDRQQVPVIVITMVENERQALARGAQAYHEKPVERQWLIDQLKRFAPVEQEQVFIVDDDERSRYVLKSFFAGTRYAIREFSSGPPALEAAAEHPPAAIFLDIGMPEMNGLEVLQRLRNEARTAHVPVVMHTAKDLASREHELLDELSASVLAKAQGDRDGAASRLRLALASAQKRVGK